jgi:predicted outer membrane lipoprotein
MENDRDAKLIEKIHQKAGAHAEATVYSLGNTYLSQEEKIEVELWFQFPGNISLVTMLTCLVYSSYLPLSWSWIIGIPLIANCLFGIINWFAYSKKLLRGIYLSIFHSFVLWILTFVAIVLLVINGAYLKALLAFFLKLFLIVFFEPHMLIYSFLSRKYGMHPKYAFFKRFYGYEFPFEEAIKKEAV